MQTRFFGILYVTCVKKIAGLLTLIHLLHLVSHILFHTFNGYMLSRAHVSFSNVTHIIALSHSLHLLAGERQQRATSTRLLPTPRCIYKKHLYKPTAPWVYARTLNPSCSRPEISHLEQHILTDYNYCHKYGWTVCRDNCHRQFEQHLPLASCYVLTWIMISRSIFLVAVKACNKLHQDSIVTVIYK